MNSAIFRFLTGVSLVSCCLSAGAAAINFDSLDVVQGFNFQPEVQSSFGFLASLNLNQHTFTPDISVASPGTNVSVVGVLSSIDWAGGVADPIVLHAMVSTANKQILALYEHQILSTASVSFNFQVWSYDPVRKVFFEAFSPQNGQPLSGLIAKQGATYLFSVASSPGTDVPNPVNFEFTITILPAPLSQFLVFRTDSAHSIVKQFGVGVQNAPTITGVGVANLSYHGATLQASINPGNAATGAEFHYGLSPSLSSYLATPVNALGSGGSSVALSTPISNLTAGATYYYQVIATNSVGSTSSSIASFNTTVLPSPQITTANRQGNNLSLAGTNGAANTIFYVLTSTNLSIPRSNWVVLTTNQFDTAGSFNCILTNAVSLTSQARFFLLQSPSN